MVYHEERRRRGQLNPYQHSDWNRSRNTGTFRNRWDYDDNWIPGEDNDPEYEEDWMVQGPYSGYGPRNYQRPDDRIHEDVCERLTRHGQIDARNVHVDVKDGVVTLHGTVKDRWTKRLVEETVDKAFGVRDVYNALRWRGAEGLERIKGKIQDGMQVVDRSGNLVGTVYELHRDHFTVERPEGDRFNLYYSFAQSVDDRVALTVTGQELQAQNWQMPEMLE
jgi:hypothetical protein